MLILYPVELEFGNIGVCEGGKMGYPKKNAQSKARTNNKINPQIWHQSQIWLQWWDLSTFTTAP